jgi:hypothetical protein
MRLGLTLFGQVVVGQSVPLWWPHSSRLMTHPRPDYPPRRQSSPIIVADIAFLGVTVKKYVLYTSKAGTVGSDGEVKLRLQVMRELAPERLSDFNGGSAEISDGYTTHTCQFEIKLANFDERRIFLIPGAGDEIQIDPEFIRKIDPNDPLNQLIEIPLKIGQKISDYIIRNSSWGLR